ncbi:Dabb family protein [Sporobolomyces koalae]|uniref:Dabb family protein n=1 Tax=Sporobolomyces koalae TaxID=500713 RepID=UPI00317A7317
MTIIHIVLTKLNGQQPENWNSDISATGQAMVGRIPGLIKCEVGPALESTKWRTQGWDQMLYAEIEDEEALKAYADHPVHVEYKNKTSPFTTDVLAFDLVV